ncbi:MAG: glycosyltransferase, partial [Spirulinaceae cyanobacterium RM2_2_10]|nr:glycosyltransferase [Spirulinaceae cyanobacterium RM2_2_10]
MSSSPAPPDSEFRPPVSVIVPIYNGEADLPGLLAALQAQTYPRDR